ncbi:MAG: phosphatidate cytidylyltransferase [Candidatus Bipolaricaulia bacterium]
MNELSCRILTAAIAISLLLIVLWLTVRYDTDWIVGLLVGLATLIAGGEYVKLIRRSELPAFLMLPVGLVYVALLAFFYLIYRFLGPGYAILILALVWSYDTGAYFAGSLWGRRLLAPQISPKKTVEGVVGGLALTAIATAISSVWLPIRAGDILGLSVTVGVFTQFGDLFESLIKRHAGVKDSGRLFPGHGGLLDRIDGLLFALPAFYLYATYAL